MRSELLLFLVLSLGFAQLIDYDYSHSTGHLYQIEQTDSDYYTSNTLVYHLETHLSVAADNWISGTGSYSDVHDGDYVCTGPANYVTSVNARVSAFSGYIPSHSGADEAPDPDWPDCGGSTSCPTSGTQYVRWSESTYNSYMDNTILDGQHLGSDYFRRSISYRESGVGSPFTNEVAESMTVMKGTASLKGGYSSQSTLYSFSPLSGTGPSHSGAVNLNTVGDYTFTQRLDATGAVIGAYNPNVDREDYRAFQDLCTNPPSCSSQNDEYSVSNVHDSAVVHVLEDEDFGVIDPTIYSVTLAGHTMTDGHYILEAGEDITTTVRVQIPARTSAYDYYLSFQLDEAQVGDPFSYTVNSGLNQCDVVGFPLRNGGWGSANAVTYVNVVGTLHVPDTLPESGGNIPFRVHWETCQGQDGCDDNGDGGWTPWFNIPYIPPGDDGPLPDLSCTLEPVSIMDTDTTTPELETGSVIEQWELTITNTGGNLTLSGTPSQQLAQYLCLVGLFNAYETNTDGTEYVYDSPGHGYYILTTSNLNLTTGETVTKILDGEVQCTEEGEIGAWTFLNIGALLSTSCGPYEFEESDWDNNFCEWNIPCVNESGPEIPEDENCTIHPTSRPGEVGGEYNFTLTCDGGTECAGAVDWTITTGGTISGNQTDATAGVLSDASDLLITATVDNTDGEDAVCHAQIYFGGEGDGNNCYIKPAQQPGLPGSHHWFDLTCSGEGIEDSDCGDVDGSPDWSILEGASFVVGSDFTEADSFHAIVDLNQFAMNTTIRIEAEVEFPGGDTAICEGEIIVPPIPCIDYV